MTRRHHKHIKQNSGEILPDPFVKGRREERMHKRNLNIYNGSFEDPRDWDKDEIVRSNYSTATYPIQEIDEYWWFAKPLMTDYRWRIAEDTYLNWLGYSDAEIEEWNKKYLKEGRTPLDINSMIRTYGAPMFLREGVHHWLPLHNITFGEWHVYYKNKNFKIPEEELIIKESPESELTGVYHKAGTGEGENGGTYAILNYSGGMTKNLSNRVYTKISLYMATVGKVRVSFCDEDGWQRLLFDVVVGRNELDLNKLTVKNVSNFEIQVEEGQLKIDRNSTSPFFKAQVYNMWHHKYKDYKSWNIGFGLWGYDTPHAWLPESRGKWHTPELDDVLQLVGQAPQKYDNVFLNVMNFLGADSRKDSSPYLLPYDKYEDISGFELYSLGAKGGGYDGEKDGQQKPPLVSPIEDSYIDGSGEEINGFGSYSAMHIGEWNDLIDKNTHRRFLFISGNAYGGPNIMRVDGGYPDAVQSAPVRYCAKKSDEELGYKFYIDEANDQVIMVGCPSTEAEQTQVQGMEELPKGLLRGIVLRYTNRLYRKVCKPLSEMREEEQEILTYIKRHD